MIFPFLGLIGAVLIYFGIAGLKTGETRNKYGMKVEGNSAQVVSVIRIVVGGILVFITLFNIAFFLFKKIF